MDFANLTAEQVDALTGYEREAWYAYRKGDIAKANAILGTYSAAKVVVESPERPVSKAAARKQSAEIKPH